MGPMYTMVLFLLGVAHLSQAKVCLGCPENMDIGNPKDYEYINNKLKAGIPHGMENENEAQLVQVLNVQKQVVSGIQYSYKFIAKGKNTNKLYDCSMVVLKQPWNGEEKVSEFNCHLLPANINKRSLLGGEVMLDVSNNGNLNELKTFIGQEIGKVQGSKYSMKVIKFFKASKQTVDGTLIRATLEVASTTCLLNEESDNCSRQTKNHQVCDIQVWLKPWVKVKEVTKVQCKPQPKFCPGCPIESDPNDVSIQQCLRRTLSNLNAESHSSEKLFLVKINKAMSQIVAGVKYTLDFDVKDETSGKLLACRSVIVSQPWISKDPTVINFNCVPK